MKRERHRQRAPVSGDGRRVQPAMPCSRSTVANYGRLLNEAGLPSRLRKSKRSDDWRMGSGMVGLSKRLVVAAPRIRRYRLHHSTNSWPRPSCTIMTLPMRSSRSKVAAADRASSSVSYRAQAAGKFEPEPLLTVVISLNI
jgi:hypothetical protein